MERKIRDILFGNRSSRAGTLPLVHTAPAYFVQKMLESKEIKPRECDVFLKEKLAYFFVGRPAYKSVGHDVSHWEMPSCVIVDFQTNASRRMFPFDSGAFARGLVPKYATMIDRDDYALAPDADVVERYIGTFFGSSRAYFMGEAIDRKEFLKNHGILPTEASLHALISLLNGERIGKALDERRSSIEIQFDKAIHLDAGAIRAVILPEIYLQDKNFVKGIELLGAQVITYPMIPLNTDHFYYAIYERCLSYYEQNGYFDV
ncbi:hypothetical protein RMR16_023395 (plasmid) [Agrobacterium sp. rho-13.3]|uniref:hypothetical protein n=1 Tax=Agrobacterium sp. rho-13.3 TaxID=3072980 RepID=UPI002A10F472|nr:hypothetical protein [Agrobacterium sp. rho-13.3]MDX8310315.1 hypothetical protein [Agrobacterium sp. rho-13.3]